MPESAWYNEWFNTIYYHILYQHRDYEEAAAFLDKLIDKFQMPARSKVLDLACGKGRHAVYLNKKGFDVTGVDLSPYNIKLAKKQEKENLHFDIHDMRLVYRSNTFDYVFNLFTSFGYFDTKSENLDVIKATMASLKSGGRFVLDFLNPYVVINHLIENEVKTIDNVTFNISRSYTEEDFIVKKIKIQDHGQNVEYMEKVKAIRRIDFLNYFEQHNLEVIDSFGDYDLNPYSADVSDRLIFVIQKP